MPPNPRVWGRCPAAGGGQKPGGVRNPPPGGEFEDIAKTYTTHHTCADCKHGGVHELMRQLLESPLDTSLLLVSYDLVIVTVAPFAVTTVRNTDTLAPNALLRIMTSPF